MTPTAKFAILVGVVGLAVLCATVVADGIGDASILLPLAAIGGALELLGPKLVPGSRFSASYLAIIAAAILSGPGAAVMVAAAIILSANVVRRRPFTRLAFNFGSLVGGALVAGSVLAYADDRSLPVLVAMAVVAVFGNYAITTGLVLAMVAIDRGRQAARCFASATVRLVPGYILLGTATAVMTGLTQQEPWTWPTLIGLAAAASLTLRQLAQFVAQPSQAPLSAQAPAKAA